MKQTNPVSSSFGRFLTVRQVADILQVHTNTMHKMAAKRILLYVKPVYPVHLNPKPLEHSLGDRMAGGAA